MAMAMAKRCPSVFRCRDTEMGIILGSVILLIVFLFVVQIASPTYSDWAIMISDNRVEISSTVYVCIVLIVMVIGFVTMVLADLVFSTPRRDTFAQRTKSITLIVVILVCSTIMVYNSFPIFVTFVLGVTLAFLYTTIRHCNRRSRLRYRMMNVDIENLDKDARYKDKPINLSEIPSTDGDTNQNIEFDSGHVADDEADRDKHQDTKPTPLISSNFSLTDDTADE